MRFVFVILRVDFWNFWILLIRWKKKKEREKGKISNEAKTWYIYRRFISKCLFHSMKRTIEHCWILYVYYTYWTPVVGILFREQKVHIHSQCSIFHLLFIVTCASCIAHTWSCRAMQVFEFSVGKLLGTFQFPSIIPGYCLERKFKVRVIRNIDKMSRSSPNRICLQVKTFLYRIFDVDSYRIIETYLRKKKKETSHQFLSSLPFFSIKSFSSAKEKKEEKNTFLFSPLHFVQRIFLETKSRRNNTRPESFIRLLHIRNIVADLCNDPCVTINRRMAGWHDKV